MIELFANLGRRLSAFGDDERSGEVIARAVEVNGWFTREEIMAAMAAIRTRMLDPVKLETWIAPYRDRLPRVRRNVLVVMAGNIPAVGFFDLLCVAMAGHRALVKASSKDYVLIYYLTSLLAEESRALGVECPVQLAGAQAVDAVIATGSDNTNRYFRARYAGVPSLLRSSRSSVAVLRGDESGAVLRLLADDVFMYSGLGCRNVSVVFVPRRYDLAVLMRALAQRPPGNPRYADNYRQRRAVLEMEGVDFIDGGRFALVEEADFPAEISQINCIRYDSPAQVDAWLAAHDHEVQCVATNFYSHPRAVPLGTTQSPSLTDYPDAVDVLDFLCGI